MSTSRKPKKVRFQPHISPDLKRRIAEHCERRGITESDFAERTFEKALGGIDDGTLFLRAIGALQRQTETLRRAVESNGELSHQHFLFYLKNTPPHDPKTLRDAAREAPGRWRNAMSAIAARLGSRRTWMDDLPREVLEPMRSPLAGSAPTRRDELTEHEGQ